MVSISLKTSVDFRMIQVKLLLLLAAIVTLVAAQNNLQPRIVQGNDAQRGQFPYYAYFKLKISKDHKTYCGGSIISPEWIVTAAHCLRKVISATVILGSLRAKDVNEAGRKTFRLNKSSFVLHEEHDPIKRIK